MSSPKYFDDRADFWRRHFQMGSTYEDYVAASKPEHLQKWSRMAESIPRLTEDRRSHLVGHNRVLNVLVYSGSWCGDCVRQGPMIESISRSIGGDVTTRWIDREQSEELKTELRLVGAMRVPVAVFLSEDFFEVGRFGDRMLAAYRTKAERELGPACDAGIVPPSAEQLAAEMSEWAVVFERMLLMLRLSPFYREKHAD